MLRTTFHDYGTEKYSHKETQEALALNEELVSVFIVPSINIGRL